MSPLGFFVIGGIVLVISGVLQVVVRPRTGRDHRWLNGATVKATFFILVGVAAILIGSGVVPIGDLAGPPGR